MAATAATSASDDDDHHHHHLPLESLPLIDLRLLSQSELYSLSLCSSSLSDSSDLYHRCDDDVLIPKIDRSVFNESAGSRKQTYSRLRLAPRKPYVPSSTTVTATIPRQTSETVDTENTQIISLLKQLFASETPVIVDASDDDDDLIPVRVEYKEHLSESSKAVLQNIPIDIVNCESNVTESFNPALVQNVPIDNFDGGSKVSELSNVACQNGQVVLVDGTVRKRKRGRPRRDENQVIESERDRKPVVVRKSKATAEANEMAIVNKNGVVVDLVALGNMEDPFGEELKKRTVGMENEEELLGFMSGLNGVWGSRRKRRRIVDASELGDMLPNGWKLMLSIKRQGGRVWLVCSRYISPHGQQFVSCKEVSSFLLSFFQLHDASQPTSAHMESTHISASWNAVEPLKDDKTRDGLIFCSPLPITSMSSDNEKQATVWNFDNPQEGRREEVLNCHKCPMTFDKKDDLLHHLISSHKGSAKKCQRGMSISDEVLLKDGKYKCQFCHKLFEERHRYNGHLGAHIKDYVKRFESSKGVLTVQKSNSVTLITPEILYMQNSKPSDNGRIVKISNAEVNDEIGSACPHNELKVDGVTGTNTVNQSHEPNLLSEEQTTKADRIENTLGEESCNKQDRVFDMTNDEVGKVDKATDKVDANVDGYLGDERDVSNILKCGTNGVINISKRGNFHNCSVSVSENEQPRVVGNSRNEVSSPSVGEQMQEMDSETFSLAPNSRENTISDVDGLLTSTIEEMDIDHRDKVANEEPASIFGNSCIGLDYVVTGVKQPKNSQSLVSPIGNEEQHGLVNNVNGKISSFTVESSQERSSASGFPTCIDEQTVVNNYRNRVSCSTIVEPKLDEVNNSGNNGRTFNFGSNYATQHESSLTSHKQDISGWTHAVAQSWNEKTSVIKNNMKVNPNSTVTELWQQKDILTPSGNVEKIYSATGNEPKFNEIRSSKESDLKSTYANSCTRVDADFATPSDPERSSKGCLLASSANGKNHNSNSFGVCNSTGTFEGFTRDRCSESGLLGPSAYKQACSDGNNMNQVSSTSMEVLRHGTVNSSWNGSGFFGYGNSYIGSNAYGVTSIAPESSESCFPVLSENKQAHVTGNDLKQKQGSENGLPGFSATEQTQCFDNNLNMVYAGKFQEGSRDGVAENIGNTELMIGFSNHTQGEEDVMADFMWRTNEENILQSGLASTSSPLVHSSGCFPTFDLMSKKGENDFFGVDKFDSISNFEGLRSNRMEHLEHSFMTAKTCSPSGDSNVMSYNAGFDQGFDSSTWLEKEALPLLPKIASRYQITAVCVWCRDEFQHDAVDSGTQNGSIGSMCGTCKAKFSGQLSLF